MITIKIARYQCDDRAACHDVSLHNNPAVLVLFTSFASANTITLSQERLTTKPSTAQPHYSTHAVFWTQQLSYAWILFLATRWHHNITRRSSHNGKYSWKQAIRLQVPVSVSSPLSQLWSNQPSTAHQLILILHQAPSTQCITKHRIQKKETLKPQN